MALLAYPPPFRAWLAFSSDPDNTTIENWRELHKLIWEELRLPFSDSLFIQSYNDSLEAQVSLSEFGTELLKHPYDVIHTWGDYVRSATKLFTRDEAEKAIKVMNQFDLKPIAWSDHSKFAGNLLFYTSDGATPYTMDASGCRYKSPFYTLDLIRKIGIRYIWDGDVNDYVGQDMALTLFEHYLHRTRRSWRRACLLTVLHVLGRPLWRRMQARLFDAPKLDNRQYSRHEFPDGNILYCYRRYGDWRKADIDGLADVIAPERIDTLISRRGTCVVYTHLGKRRPERIDDAKHIPETTERAFRYLKKKYVEKVLNLSTLGDLLDYLVCRDHAQIDAHSRRLTFEPDGIRFREISLDVLRRFQFGLWLDRPEVHDEIEVYAGGERIDCALKEVVKNHVVISFPG